MPNALKKTCLNAFLCFFLVVLASAPAYAILEKPVPVVLKSNIYSVPEGLSQSIISSMVEDKDGYLWIGTLNGLNRFDGKKFKHYFAKNEHSPNEHTSNEASNLPSSVIKSLFIDHQDRLFVGTDKGLSLYHPESDNFEPLFSQSELKGAEIWSIQAHRDTLLIGTRHSIFTIDFALTTVKHFPSNKLFNRIQKILPIHQGLLVRNHNGDVIKVTDNQSIKIATNSTDIDKFQSKPIILKSTGIFGIDDNHNQFSFLHKNDTIVKVDDGFIGLNGRSIFKIDYHGNKHNIGTINNIPKNIEHPKILFSKSGIYIISKSQGFIYVNNKINFISSLLIGNKNIWSLFKGGENNIIVSTDSTIIKTYNLTMDETQEFETNIYGYKSVISIENEIIIATLSGLYSLNKQDKNIIKLIEGKYTTVTKGHEDDTFFAGSADGKVISFKNNEITKITIDNKSPVYQIMLDNNNLWIATQGGLFKLSINNDKYFVKKIFSSDMATSLSQDSNNIYFGTRTSLLKYDKLTKEISKVFSNNKSIYAIEKVDHYIVASSMQEVIFFNTETQKSYTLSHENGSQNEYNSQAILNFNHHLLIGGIEGISIISPKEVENYISNGQSIKTYFTRFSILNIKEKIGGDILKKSLNNTENITLKHSDYPFTFKFNSPGNTYQNIEYFYQMQGLSDNWISTQGNHAATYTNLSPGHYTFHVYAIDPITGASGPIRKMGIDITPPWWLSNKAKVLYCLAVLFLSLLIIKTAIRRREIQQRIVKSEERLKLSLWGSGDEMWDWDIKANKIYRSNIWGDLAFPRDGKRMRQSDETSNIHPMDLTRVNKALSAHLDGKTTHFEAAYRVQGAKDNWIWILDRAKVVERSDDQQALRMTGTIKNISHFKQTEEQLRLFERAIQNISEGMFILDENFTFVEVNQACCHLLIQSKQEFMGRILTFERYPKSFSKQIRSILQQQGRWSSEVESIRPNQEVFLMALSIDAIYDEQDQLSHYVGIFSDISRRKQQEEELRQLTNNDALTHLPNRSNLMVTLGNLVKRDSHHTLMVLDLDNFKKINDSMGHQVGDQLLIMVSKRIKDSVPDQTGIYRLGGDEFAILIDNNPDIGSSAIIANNVIDSFNAPFELHSETVVVGLSIGIVLYPEDDQHEQALLRKADIAMYHAKSAGGNRYQFYSEALNRNAIRRLEVETLIREGLRKDLFEVYYQPKIKLSTGKIIGMEALVRLNHSEHGLIPPNDFIPLAEENGLIIDIGELVLKKACFAAQQWRIQGLFNGRVAVNLSSKQFALPDLQQRIASILRLTQLPAMNLELEITEGTVIHDPETAIKVMQQLNKMGISLALDDFGTGYSSLSYLKRFPIHSLKIDKAFIDDIDKSDKDLKMVDSIITMAHNMELSVVAEGVEHSSQLSILKALKCEYIQGYIYDKPMPLAQYTQRLMEEAPHIPPSVHSAENPTTHSYREQIK
ncbi:EAL domain-containing protein [uncultured Shewanella sp.]|uniref:EAL domain-containing protein n=1 Tax=uncultured Shewanella sp. TaxID=173975 RepID=UPI0026394269|nr:EAL domain-containing protein [uncultured Shewanella sp.]